MLKQQLDKDLKAALLAGDKDRVTTLRGLKSAILYAEVAKGAREQGLPDNEVLSILAKEAKKRDESAGFYKQAGNEEKAEAEFNEKKIIESYLPAQMSDDDLLMIIDQVIGEQGSGAVIGQIIGVVKQRTEGKADGARIAQFVKERL